MSATWLIIGATSPLVRAFAIEAATQGARLVLAARDTDELETIAGDIRLRSKAEVTTLTFDAADPASTKALADKAAELDNLSVMVGHGIMPDEIAARDNEALALQQWEVNTLCIVRLLNRLTPKFEAQKSGSIVVIGSVAGDRGRKKNYQYGATKAGLAAFVEGLGAHLSGFGVKVVLVKPGIMDTRMTWGTKGPPLPKGTPEGLAKAMWKKAGKGGVLYYPWFWFFIMKMIQQLPVKIFNKLNF